MNSKPIDINQRIPLDILQVALQSYLDGTYSENYIEEQLRLEFKGQNRIKKAVRIVNKTVVNNPLRHYLLENKSKIQIALKNRTDRNIILISLLNTSFSFSFDSLRTLGKLFTAQDLLSRDALRRHLTQTYGGNRSTSNAIDSVVPMFLEAQFFTRPKIGFYEWKSPLVPLSPVTEKAFKESFKINSNQTELQEYQLMDPYFKFIGASS